MRAVIDTNVLISAIFWTGSPKRLLNRVRRGEVTFVTSRVLLDELKEILVRPDKPFKLTEEEADRVVKAIQNVAEVVETQSQVRVCRDEKDNKVLECAVDGRAEWIITGDAHLLELQSFKNVRIVTVAEFLRRF